MIKVLSCDTCAKWKGKQCAVLIKPIGWTEECWAWTDDLKWEDEIEEATRDGDYHGGAA